ncbi:lipopolysaccharide transport periplasmic protein LptA [Helicobacter valdiviensis]|uniref:Lipopolysaccharide transport periplasmic protein LptA n=1 Tax=Helicobacter valdiviensis TaxID=1458358 RepID=A0A2W6MX03_9HELI|nr:lipopolysaccharide transport periplasmic protein LptA [Helicobacter valdiviensis]PZT48937.1 lipopolysaccharide transport periplasmic protein LptA [Helicobacter valdiviensis]
MKRFFLLTFLCLSPLLCDEIQVSAQELSADETSKLTHLKGDVRIKRLEDRLHADEMFIYFNKQNRPEKMEAKNNVQFWLTLKDSRKIEGSADTLIYFPQKEEYQLIGKAFVKEPAKKNEVRGDKIIIEQKKGAINVLGDTKKPAVLIFELEKEK